MTTAVGPSFGRGTPKPALRVVCATPAIRASVWRRNGFPVEFAIVLGKLGHLDRLVGGDVVERLGCSARRPVDFEHSHLLALGQADRLLERVRTPATAGGDVAVNRLAGVRRPSPP